MKKFLTQAYIAENGNPRKLISILCPDRVTAVRVLERIGPIRNDHKASIRQFLEGSNDGCQAFAANDTDKEGDYNWINENRNFGWIQAVEEYSGK